MSFARVSYHYWVLYFNPASQQENRGKQKKKLIKLQKISTSYSKYSKDKMNQDVQEFSLHNQTWYM